MGVCLVSAVEFHINGDHSFRELLRRQLLRTNSLDERFDKHIRLLIRIAGHLDVHSHES